MQQIEKTLHYLRNLYQSSTALGQDQVSSRQPNQRSFTKTCKLATKSPSPSVIYSEQEIINLVQPMPAVFSLKIMLSLLVVIIQPEKQEFMMIMVFFMHCQI